MKIDDFIEIDAPKWQKEAFKKIWDNLDLLKPQQKHSKIVKSRCKIVGKDIHIVFIDDPTQKEYII